MKRLALIFIVLFLAICSYSFAADSKISALPELSTPFAIDDEIAMVDTSAGTTKKIAIGNLVMPAYFADSTESDQGAAGSGRTIKDLADTIGTNYGCIVLTHHGSASTAYVFDTSLNLGTKNKLYFLVQVGAYVDQNDGDETFTVYSPSHILNPSTSKISDGDTLAYANVPTTNVGNVGAGEDDLMSATLLADTLEATGASIKITAWGYTAANANNKTLKLYLGSTALYNSTATAANDKTWSLEAVVIRTGTTAQKYTILSGTWNGSVLTCTRGTTSETLTTDLTIKCTGEATSNNDIVQEALLVESIE